jgi:hypothetical protein
VNLRLTLLFSFSLLFASDASADELQSTADLDGVYIALGPVASLVRVESEWDGAFGGELMLVRVTENHPIGALGLAFGGVAFAEREGGRLWADALVATNKTFGISTGLSLGPTVEVHEVTPPRWGGQATLWVYAGVIPYVRVGAVADAGTFVDIGIKISLPALRF